MTRTVSLLLSASALGLAFGLRLRRQRQLERQRLLRHRLQLPNRSPLQITDRLPYLDYERARFGVN
jgi:hypothetical protein